MATSCFKERVDPRSNFHIVRPVASSAGNFVARDDYLGSYSLAVLPGINPPGIGVPSPSSDLVNTPAAPGAGWTLDTVDMKPCGYVIRVVAVDRAIIDSQTVGHHSSASAGFCLDLEED